MRQTPILTIWTTDGYMLGIHWHCLIELCTRLKTVRWVDLDVKCYPVPIRHVLYASVAGRQQLISPCWSEQIRRNVERSDTLICWLTAQNIVCRPRCLAPAHSSTQEVVHVIISVPVPVSPRQLHSCLYAAEMFPAD